MSDPRAYTATLEYLRHAITSSHTHTQAAQRALYVAATKLDGEINGLEKLLEGLEQLTSKAEDWTTNDGDFGAHVLAVFERWYESRQALEAEVHEAFGTMSESVSTAGAVLDTEPEAE